MAVYVGLPARDEAAALPGLIEKVLAMGYRVVAVDDGSTDGTGRLLEEISRLRPGSVSVVFHPENLGLGAALASIFREFLASAGPGDVLATMDADGTHDPAQLPEMLAEMERGGWDVVVASRWIPGWRASGVPAARSLGSRLLNLALAWLTGAPDSTCGYRVYKYEALAAAPKPLVTERGFAAQFEVLWRLAAAGARVGAVPLRLRYDLKGSPSKMRPWRTAAAVAALVLRNLPAPEGGEEKWLSG